MKGCAAMETTLDQPVAERVLDFCDPKLYDDPWETYRWLRDNAPIYRDTVNDLWVVSRHEDVFHISRNPERYCNRLGVRPKLAADMSLIALDDPEHTRQRRLINKGFTPRRVRELAPHIRELANQIIDEVSERGEIDFVEDFAIHVPLIVISEMMGLDPETRSKMYRWSDSMMAGDGHTEADDPVLLGAATAFGEFAEMCAALIAERRAEPTDDLISALTTAFDKGELQKDDKPFSDITEALHGEGRMGDDELFMFLTLLLVAGNETTRNALTGGLLAFSMFPDQKQKLIDNPELIDLAVDEIIRFVSPVLTFSRTVTEDHTYKGVDFKEGDKVLMLYQSANRDERVFDAPDELRVDRDPNPHLAFGTGTHYCLGANLARLEVKLVFEELFKRLADIRVPEGVPLERGESSLVLALQHLPAVFTPVPRAPEV
jgi:cholest-4-en-3-one 26-monooxygenase